MPRGPLALARRAPPRSEAGQRHARRLRRGLPRRLGHRRRLRRRPAPPWLTRAADLATVCGTPGYLAPEMASGDGPAVGVATDVYGLGALLHEVLTGRPPHRGHTLRDLLLAAFASPPIEFGPGVPKELAAIANRAMARDPAERYPSAAAFRQALEGFRAHRSAARLTEDADRRLDALVARASVRAGVRASADDAELERLAGECRLAYDQALALWPESPEAQAGKARLLEHLRRDQAARDAEVAALRRLGRDTDVNANRLSRSRLAMITGALWLLWNLGSAFAVEQLGWRLDYAALFASAGGTVVVCAIGLSLFRRSLATTAIDRSILGLFAAMFAVVVLFWIGTAQVGLDPMRAIAAAHPFYLAFALSLAFFFDRRCLLPAIAIAPATPLAPLVPEHALEIAGLVGGVLSLWLALIWRRPATAPIFAARVE
ncbi:MAG: hypothetical protein U1F43_07535 [Myxococcota bacterium]